MMDKLQDSLAIFTKKFGSSISFISKYKFTFVFLIAASAVALTVLQTQSYLSTSRNETIYQEESVKINYGSIDQEIVDEISSTLDDANIEVDSSFVPGRSNPFAE